MSSHVLEDIARTCDAVVVMREGQVAVTRPIETDDRQASSALHVRVSGDTDAFVAAIGRRGVLVENSEDGVLVLVSDNSHGLPDAVRDAAAESGAGLRELRPAGPSLEDSLLEAMT
jgi:ABC-2 type transport system ATP-binding protein